MTTNQSSEQKLTELMTQLFSENTDLRWQGVGEAWQLPGYLVEVLINILQNDPHVGLRCGAANSLGNLHDKRAVEPLIAALHDEDRHVRQFAVEALGALKDTSAIAPLIQTFTDKERTVAQEVPDALSSIGEAALEPVIELLQTQDTTLHYWAILTLGHIGGPRALEALIAIQPQVTAEIVGNVNLGDFIIKTITCF
jgi:HEAT repeat protein